LLNLAVYIVITGFYKGQTSKAQWLQNASSFCVYQTFCTESLDKTVYNSWQLGFDCNMATHSDCA